MSPEIFNAKTARAGTHSQKKIGTSIPTQHSQPQHSHHHRRAEDYSTIIASNPPSTNSLASFAVRPVGVTFDSQEPDEEVLLFLRQHISVNIPWLIAATLMIITPLILLPLFSPFKSIPWNFQFVLVLSWYLLTAGFAIEKILMWLFNSFIITDERMVDIDLYSLIFKETNYAQLDKIQDVTVKTGGALNSLLDIGDVFVQTASEVPEFVFDNIYHPTKVAKLLNELMIEEHREELEGRIQ
ncbi:MAG: hypothetical protein A2804_01185 [Candidatus Pacebacteria bacterium RIFCSPHIGHO2_01_FULL_46_10]|nr:MAG: hypothetical protein A2804_01185 [Candidatus Pacebacteria bacterium RIFCSPHIGHO2_01_FULL_46_10]